MSAENRDPIVLDHHRRQAVTAITLGDADEDGARLLTLQTNSPDVFVLFLPAEANEYIKERYNGGITVAGAHDLAKLKEKG